MDRLMPPLVPIPWQPSLLLTPDTLALLVAAGKRLGVNLFVYQAPDGPLDGAWRPLARQEFLYRKALAGGNIASNPYSGQRMHMRGGAFDLVRTDTAVQAACRAVGLIRDPSEAWHWNNPRLTSMPIIAANVTVASSNSKPLSADTIPDDTEEDDDMTMIYLALSDGNADGIYKGWRYMQTPDGILRPMSSAEWAAFEATHPNQKVAPWDGAELSKLVASSGMYQFTGDPAKGLLGLTGKIIGRNATKTSEAGSKSGHWPRIETGLDVGF
jgi:hypothetical protein